MSDIQLPVPNPMLTGSSFSAQILDPISGAPVNVIRHEDSWAITCTWSLSGPVAALLGGTWRLQAAFEAVGPGPEFLTPVQTVAYSSGTLTGVAPNQTMSFATTFNFPAYSPQLLPAGAEDMAYEVAIKLTYLQPNSQPGPFAAVYDVGLIEVYDSNLPGH